MQIPLKKNESTFASHDHLTLRPDISGSSMIAWSEVELLLLQELTGFLEESLPQLGGVKWWQNHVIEQLTPLQAPAAEELDDGELRGLDLAALLRVATSNWSELAFRFALSKSGREDLKRLQGARNRHAHRTVNGMSIEDIRKDIEAAVKFLECIEANAASVEHCCKILKSVASAVADSANSVPIIKTSESTRNGHIKTISERRVIEGRPDEPSMGKWLVDTKTNKRDLESALADTTYIGIDFGTSTTVVSFAYMDADRLLTADTLKLAQPNRDGGTTRDHLVNSVLAYKGKKVLFGLDAHNLRPRLQEGRSVFTSFKMHLGVEVGPTYPNSLLRRGFGPIVIERAIDATTEFFKLLHKEIIETVAARKLPGDLKFAISVPASFEANQRRALLNCAENAGLNVDASCLIDEPNAAFLSFMNDCIHHEQDVEMAQQLKQNGLNLLVYDFGAGTCDVSVLHVALPDGKVQSRNLAISKFAALGGDDIDRKIAKEILVPQLLANNEDVTLTQTTIDSRLVPVLMPTAERLKIVANKWLADRNQSSLEDLAKIDQRFSDHPFELKISTTQTLRLPSPGMSTIEFACVLQSFMKPFDELEPGQHVFSPVDDALSKSGLSPFELNAVLFIGGSAKSPLVQHSVMRHLPETVRKVVPRDLRSHVSTGAAVHSLGFHGFGYNIVEPITSEPIFVITRGGGLDTIVPASTKVPSSRPFELNLTIERSDQQTVELPVCVSSESKLLGLLRLNSLDGAFTRGTRIHVSASITTDKLLLVEAEADGVKVNSTLLDPLANRELSVSESKLLEARQQYNVACLAAYGRPDPEDVIKFAFAAQRANEHILAGDLFVQVDARPEYSGDHATSICYSYSRAGRPDLSRKWSKIAYERKPNATTAYNMSCNASGDAQEKYLREALQYNRDYESALISLGSLLIEKGDGQGKKLLYRATESLKRELENNVITLSDCKLLERAANLLKDKDLAARANARRATLDGNVLPFQDDNLADSMGPQAQMEDS